ncbi:MAG: hypothetical protein LBM93_10325, partial [Oscillospiraceae bacterium]|nr:hypothetical protein [Oscillospiraceae bacterium]
MKKSDYQFYSLTPIDDVDLGIYESALDFVFSDNKVKNVAVSGSYGAGKSSIIASYKKNHTDKKFLHISLAHFRQSDKEKETTNEEPFCNTEATLEGKILNQLIHQIPQNKIPLTNFRIKKSISKISNILTSALAIIGTLSGLYFFFFSKWTGFVDSLQKKWLKDSIDFSILPETRFFAGLGFIVISGIFAYNLIKLQKNKHIIKNANVSGVEIEIFQDCNESYFDKYLNDVLYLFENADSDVIVFEDIDRYDSISIFERLHEINTLVNNNREKNPLRFFYLLKDDIFENKDRTKFFDFIIPVVPVVDGSNSFNKFLECFEKSGVLEKGINREFLQGLSLYIDDMRILQNICNEFLIYHTRLSTTEQDPNKMLALIAYKNIFPRDFADLQLSKGFMFEIIGGKGKERLISSEKKRLKQELESKENEIKRVQEEILKGKGELSIVFCKKVFGHSGWWNWDETFRNQQLLSYENNIQYKPIIDEYKKRVSYIEENRISPLENEITKIKSERIALSGLRLSELITRENVDNFFKDTVFKSETGNEDAFNIIKDSPYFDMIKYLVREGYIDETYSDYMTYFYENSLSR